MKRLIEQTACEHGKYEEHVTMRGQAAPRCPGGESREVTVDYEAALRRFNETYYGRPDNIELVVKETVDAALEGS